MTIVSQRVERWLNFKMIVERPNIKVIPVCRYENLFFPEIVATLSHVANN
jgi:hypothetical protein